MKGNPNLHELERLRNSVRDWEVAVDDARRDLDLAHEMFREAVRERDHAAARLAELVASDNNQESDHG